MSAHGGARGTRRGDGHQGKRDSSPEGVGGEGDDDDGVRATSAARATTATEHSSLAERAMTTAERSSLGASSFDLGGGGLPREEAGLYRGYL